MVRAGEGSKARDFAALVGAHRGAVFGVILRRTGNRDLAEELMQETFLRAWRARDSLRSPDAARGWLCAIAANLVRDHARQHRINTDPIHHDIPASGADPADRYAAAAQAEQVREALASLPPNHREMFLLRERDGLSYREIADVLACPMGSVMSGLARAREKLLEAMRA